MKRIILILCIVLLVVAFSSCGTKDDYNFQNISEDIITVYEKKSAIDDVKNDVIELKQKINENKPEDQDIDDRRQIAVAILEQAVGKLEKNQNEDLVSKTEIENDIKLALGIWESTIK